MRREGARGHEPRAEQALQVEHVVVGRLAQLLREPQVARLPVHVGRTRVPQLMQRGVDAAVVEVAAGEPGHGGGLHRTTGAL